MIQIQFHQNQNMLHKLQVIISAFVVILQLNLELNVHTVMLIIMNIPVLIDGFITCQSTLPCCANQETLLVDE